MGMLVDIYTMKESPGNIQMAVSLVTQRDLLW